MSKNSMKIIILDKTKGNEVGGKGGYHAYFFGSHKDKPIEAFSKTEKGALENLASKLSKV